MLIASWLRYGCCPTISEPTKDTTSTTWSRQLLPSSSTPSRSLLVYTSVCPTVCLPVCPSVCLFFCLSVYLLLMRVTIAKRERERVSSGLSFEFSLARFRFMTVKINSIASLGLDWSHRNQRVRVMQPVLCCQIE